jgi:hypoxanthine phosphoribosyltransferase
MQIPDRYKPLYSADEIEAQVERIGREVTNWAREVREQTGQDILGIPVLRGGIFFFSDLVRKVDCSIRIAPVKTWGYDSSANQLLSGGVKVNLVDIAARDRHVLLIDDICDTGRTLRAVGDTLMSAGACGVRSAVLIKRVLTDETFEPNYVGFRYNGPEWLVGYGMDDAEQWRNLSGIYVVRKG